MEIAGDKSNMEQTPLHPAIEAQPWREAFRDGKKYYWNKATNLTQWAMPDEYAAALNAAGASATPATPVAP